jgi:hypothetical protein
MTNDIIVMEKKKAMEIARVGDLIQVVDFSQTDENNIPVFSTGIIVECEGVFNVLFNDGDYGDSKWWDGSLSDYISQWFDNWNNYEEMIILISNQSEERLWEEKLI